MGLIYDWLIAFASAGVVSLCAPKKWWNATMLVVFSTALLLRVYFYPHPHWPF